MWGLPYLALSPSDAPVAFWRYGSRFRRVARAHYTIPVPWTLGLLWPTSPVPGVPSQQMLTFHSHAPSQSMNSCTPPNGFRAFSQHQQQDDLLLVNLTNPLTNITLTPGSLGWVSLLPHSFIRTMHSTFTPYTLRPADPYSLIVHIVADPGWRESDPVPGATLATTVSVSL